jgi:hypothetical protein
LTLTIFFGQMTFATTREKITESEPDETRYSITFKHPFIYFKACHKALIFLFGKVQGLIFFRKKRSLIKSFFRVFFAPFTEKIFLKNDVEKIFL